MYNSPIDKIIGEMKSQMVKDEENQLMVHVTQEIGYDVDKDDLIKALQYDRNQYEKGYADGLKASKWIPIKTRPMTDDEKEYYSEYTICDCDVIYNCQLPEDGQEVLVTDKYGNVEVDTFCIDEGCYFENNCDVDDVIAWMPLPTRYINDLE